MDDFEFVATKLLTRKAWAYYFSASDDMISKSINNSVYRSILLRPRVFVNCVACDTSTSLFGQKVGTPLYASPTAMARLAHSDGEWGIAQGISRFGAVQIVSNNASMTPEQVVRDAPKGQVFGWQLYVQNNLQKSEAMLERISRPEMRKYYKFLVLTLDAPWPGKRELDERMQFEGGFSIKAGDDVQSPPVAKGGIGQQLFAGTAADLTWETTLPWLVEKTDLPIVLKGVQTYEDALLAARHADKVRVIILSNHGGRGVDTAPPAVHTLLEIRKYCPEVFEKIDIWVDGGIKRGTDIVKALCLGAKGVGIGRLPLWGLAAGGKRGVERVFENNADVRDFLFLASSAGRNGKVPETFRCSDNSGFRAMINTRAVERDCFAGVEKPAAPGIKKGRRPRL
ncbi:hypothetical protein B7463_g7543, partial [Scytalidium lignicola]